MKIRKRNIGVIKNWLPVVLWCVLIFFVSSLPQLPKLKITTWDRLLKNAAHFFEYAVLYFLIIRALGFKKYWLALVLGGAYAVSDELHQSFVPSRVPSLQDLFVDIMGMLTTLLIVKKGKK